MPHPHRSCVIPAPVDQVWSVVRRFDGLPAWRPVFASSSLDSGAEDHHHLTYTILQSPFAARRYVSTMRPVLAGRTVTR